MKKRGHVKAFVAAAAFAAFGATESARAADWYQGGNIVNITSNTDGLMIALDTGPPTNCAGTPWGWMLIPQANKTMVAVVLGMWLSGKKLATVYVATYTGSGYCTVIQVDPVE